MTASPYLETLRKKTAAARREVDRLTGPVEELTKKISATDWALLGYEQRQGVWRDDALKARDKFNEQLRPLQRQLQKATQEHQKLNSELYQSERDESERAAEREWRATTREELLGRCAQAVEQANAAEAAIDKASEQVTRQVERLVECEEAQVAVAAAQAALTDAQSRTWLNNTVETSAAEREASDALTNAQANAERAAAARPLIEDELTRARAALAAAEELATRARDAKAATRLALARFDWNEAVSKLGAAWGQMADVDARAARALAQRLREGVATYDRYGQLKPLHWVAEASR